MIGLIFALAVSIVLPVAEVPVPAPSPAPSPADAPSPAPPSERKICRTEQETYSRMAAKRICRTAAEWKAIDGGVAGSVDTRRRERGIR